MIRVTKNDTAPSLTFTIKRLGTEVDLTGATVQITGRKNGAATNKFQRNATIDSDPTTGKCTFDWITGDLDFEGELFLEIQITYTDGTIETVPERVHVLVGSEF